MCFFFFNDTATTEIYTLSLHDALPIFTPPTTPARTYRRSVPRTSWTGPWERTPCLSWRRGLPQARSEEHTSELQSRQYLVCRLLLEKKKNNLTNILTPLLLEITHIQYA